MAIGGDQNAPTIQPEVSVVNTALKWYRQDKRV